MNDNEKYNLGYFIDNNEIINEKSLRSKFYLGIEKLTICVYSGEGSIPHFHLSNVDNSFNCCICLLKPKIFYS